MTNEVDMDIILASIKELWMRFPEWRFGQLVSNVVCAATGSSTFYIENKDFLRGFEKFEGKGLIPDVK
jgi:hypothetical protein